MSIALYPGSFDPVTLGHLDVIERAAAQFDELIVCTMFNYNKHGLFTPEERVELLRKSVAGLANVRVDCCSGLLVDYAKAHGVTCVVKGIRSIGDFEAERQMATINSRLYAGLDTFLLMSKPELEHISSTIVKELASYGVSLKGYVPAPIEETVARRVQKKPEQKEGTIHGK